MHAAILHSHIKVLKKRFYQICVCFFAETAQGQGIYFTSTVSEARQLWSDTFSEYLYFVEAEVLTGKSVPGNPDLILPPPLDVDPQVHYDSVSGGRGISVIFTGYQALPLNIITCKKR